MLGDPNSPLLSAEDLARLPRPSITSWMAVNKPKLNDPEPARIVSDIAEPTTGQSSAAGALATNSRIQAAQLEWERRNQGQSQSRPSTGVSSLRPPQHHRKRESPSSDSSVAKRQNNETYSTAREGALRFTEEEVARQMAELNNSSVNSMNSTMHFATGNELLKKYTSKVTPVPIPVPVSVPAPAPATKTQTAPAKSPDAVAVGDNIVAITIAEGDRPYSMYPLPDGEMVSARGAIIPPNYKLHDDPDLQFICPVRDCRRLFKGLKGLGGHFSAGHRSSTLNDNGDGTLSKIGSYQKNGPGNTPGIVISRNPLPPDAPPPVDPGLSVFAMFQQQRMSRAQEQLAKNLAHEHPVFSSPSPSSLSAIRDDDPRAYIHQFLDPSQEEFRREDIDTMACFIRQRHLPESWKHAHAGKTLDINHYACAIAYITGRVVTGSEQCTANRTRPSARLSQPCIALPLGMSLSAKQAFSSLESCVGCRYWCHLQRRSNACDWCPFPMPRVRASASGSGRSSSSEDEPTTMEIDDEVEAPIVGTMTETIHENKRPKRDSSMNTKDQPAVSIRKLGQSSPITANDHPTVISGQSQMGNADLEMEDWEVAPGRMKDDFSNNIAFSNSYLTSNHPVTVSEDVSFNVTVLKPGHSSHWNAEDDKLRTCSVAAGKVRVTMGENTFHLGPNGMFVIRPGQACKVENRLYLDSVVHCTTIGDFSLQ